MFSAAEGDQLDQIIRRPRVQGAALPARVGEGVHPHLGDVPHATGAHCPQHLEDGVGRPAVGLD